MSLFIYFFSLSKFIHTVHSITAHINASIRYYIPQQQMHKALLEQFPLAVSHMQ